MIAEYAELARSHAPLLMLALLLCGAAGAVMTPHARLSWLLALVAALAASAVAGEIAALLVRGEMRPIAEAGVALSLDGVAAFAAPLLAGLAALTLISAGASLDTHNRVTPLSMSLTLSAAAGWIGALLASDIVGLVIAAQIGWLASVAVVAFSGPRGSLNGAMRMWAAGGVGAAFMVVGLAFVQRGLGSADVAAAASAQNAAPMLTSLGFMLLLMPLALAAGVAPLHAWAGAAYGRAGGLAALLLGTIGVVGPLAVLARLAAYAASAPAIADGVAAALVALGAASVVIGSVQAIGAVNIGRLFAYAAATQAGCVLLAIALGSPAGFAAALVQIFALGAAALCVLGGSAVVKGSDLGALDGLGRRAPLASIAITAGALSLMGAPLTVGFLGRWRLIEASVGAGWWWATGAAIAASLAAVFYGGRLIERIYFRRATETSEIDRGPWRLVRAPALAAALAAIALGLQPSLLLEAASRAAALVLGRGP